MDKRILLCGAASMALLMGAGCSSAATETSGTTANTPAAQGRAVITVTDASTNPAVTAVVVTVDKVEVHNSASDWVTASSTVKTYDLIKLKQTGVSALLADVNLAAGTYDQVRLDISNVSITAGGKTSTAKLPSNTLKLVGNLTITGGETSTASLDFDVDKSVHLTGNGTYILAPVVKWVATDNATVTVKSDQSVEVSGGEVEGTEMEGQDVDGETKANFQLPTNLDIDSSGHIKVVTP